MAQLCSPIFSSQLTQKMTFFRATTKLCSNRFPWCETTKSQIATHSLSTILAIIIYICRYPVIGVSSNSSACAHWPRDSEFFQLYLQYISAHFVSLKGQCATLVCWFHIWNHIYIFLPLAKRFESLQ